MSGNAPSFLKDQSTARALSLQGIPESQHGGGWKGPYSPSHSTPAMDRDLPPRQGLPAPSLGTARHRECQGCSTAAPRAHACLTSCLLLPSAALCGTELQWDGTLLMFLPQGAAPACPSVPSSACAASRPPRARHLPVERRNLGAGAGARLRDVLKSLS